MSTEGYHTGDSVAAAVVIVVVIVVVDDGGSFVGDEEEEVWRLEVTHQPVWVLSFFVSCAVPGELVAHGRGKSAPFCVLLVLG